jgi:hypothetical protein
VVGVREKRILDRKWEAKREDQNFEKISPDFKADASEEVD